MVFEYDDHGSVQTKIFMLNYPSFDYESFLLEKVVGITMFSLRANIYFANRNLHQETLSFYWFDLSNKSLIPIQEFTDPFVSYLQFTLGSHYFDGLPLYV